MMQANSQEILLPVKTGFVVLSLFAALLLNMLPWAGVWLALRPDFAAVVLLYWCIYHPGRLGFGAAWGLGLVMDVSDAALFGQHALAYAVLVFLAIYLYRRVLRFGMKHQMMHVFLLLLLIQLIMLAVRSAAGADFPGWSYFVSSLTGAALWPLARHALQLPQRQRHDPDSV